MIRSSGAFLSNDVCLQCRVRRSPFAINPQFGPIGDYTCTMRNWESRSESSINVQQHQQGPELVMTPIRSMLSTRDDSPARRCSATMASPATTASSFSILLENIMVVDCFTTKAIGQSRISITTLSTGYFEFDCITQNGHDILLAFLTAGVPSERMVNRLCTVDDGRSVKSTASSVTSCLDLDVDGLTARHLKYRADRETWPEKFSRRFGRVAHTLQEISGTICDMTCCQGTNNANNINSVDYVTEQRDRPPLGSCQLEMDENDSQMPTSISGNTDSSNCYSYERRSRYGRMSSELVG